MLEVGEKSSVWDTDLLRPRKSGALLGDLVRMNCAMYIVVLICYAKLFVAVHSSMKSKSALRPTYLT